MISPLIFNQRVDVLRRAAAAAPGPETAYDAWNAPAYGADAVVATVDGRIRPLTVTEQAALSEAGATSTGYRAMLEAGTDVRIGDRLRASGQTYEVAGVIPDPAGTDYYVLVYLTRVTP